MNKKVYILRAPSDDQGTFGFLFTWGFSAYTLELPWRGNVSNFSCIPKGEYKAIIRMSNKFGRVYWILEVEGRTYILMHSGNFAGDTKKGFKTHSHGCILMGKRIGKIKGQRAVLLSRNTLRRFMNHMKYKPFTLVIEDFEE